MEKHKKRPFSEVTGMKLERQTKLKPHSGSAAPVYPATVTANVGLQKADKYLKMPISASSLKPGENRPKKAHSNVTVGDVDIDAIFGSLASKKEDKRKQDEIQAQKAVAIKAPRYDITADIALLEKEGHKANRVRAPDSPEPLRFDASMGMQIYSAEALKIGKGAGDTAQCPFDCACCY